MGENRDREFCENDRNTRTKFVEENASVTIAGNTFSNVRKFELDAHTFDYLGDEVQLTIHWADTDGWVRVEKTWTGTQQYEDWNLVRWNIQL